MQIKLIDNSEYEYILTDGEIFNIDKVLHVVTVSESEIYYRIAKTGINVWNFAWLDSTRFVVVE